MTWTRSTAFGQTGAYTFDADPRFRVVPETRITYGGSHGSTPIFGRMDSDGNTYITGWHVEVEGSPKRFSPARLLRDAQAKVLDPSFREWALDRAQA